MTRVTIPATGDNNPNTGKVYVPSLGIWVPKKSHHRVIQAGGFTFTGTPKNSHQVTDELGNVYQQSGKKPLKAGGLTFTGPHGKPKKGTYAYYLAQKNQSGPPNLSPSRPYNQMAPGNLNYQKKNLGPSRPYNQMAGQYSIGHKDFKGGVQHFQGPTQADYLAQLAAQLNQGKVDYEDALRKSAQEIRHGYHIDIKAIRNTIAQARHSEKKNSRKVGQMYNALSRSFNRAANRQDSRGAQDVATMQNIANIAAANITNNAQQILSGEADLAQGLGLPVAPSDQLRANALQGVTDTESQGVNAATTAQKISNSQRNFLTRGAQGAKFEGTDAKAQLLSSLQDFVNQNRSNIASLKGQRARELAANRGKILDTVASMNQKQAEDTWQRAMDLAQFNLDVQNSRAKNRLSIASLKEKIAHDNAMAAQQASSNTDSAAKDNPLYGAMQMLVGAPHPKQDAGIIQSLFKSRNFTMQEFQGPDGQVHKLTPEMAANLAEQRARAAGITNPRDIAKIRLAAMKSPSLS